MQRRERHEVADGREDRVVDEHRLGEARPAVHHPVADRGELDVVQRRPVGLERLERRAERVLVGGQRQLLAVLDAVGSGVAEDAARTGGVGDPLRQAHRLALPGLGVEQAVLQRGRPRVDDQDERAHAGVSFSCWAWMAVIATVLTMSRTVAPRDRSLTGLRSPCSTGPMATAPAERWTAL